MLIPNYAYIFLGITIDVAAPKVVWLENKLNGVTPKPMCSLLRTPETTRIPGQPTGTRSPEVPEVKIRRRIRRLYPGHSPSNPPPFLLLLLLLHHSLQRRRRKIHRKPAMLNLTWTWKPTWTMTVTSDDPITAFLSNKFCIEVTSSLTLARRTKPVWFWLIANGFQIMRCSDLLDRFQFTWLRLWIITFMDDRRIIIECG